MEKFKKYTNESSHSYTLGAFPTFELLNNRIQSVQSILISEESDHSDMQNKIISIAEEHNIPVIESGKTIRRIGGKRNTFIAGVFEKYQTDLSSSTSHIVLDKPQDMGNLGTIFRTALAFGIRDIAIIEPAADYFHPKTIRASMGALFQLHIKRYESFDNYFSEHGTNHQLYAFMTNGEIELTSLKDDDTRLVSLIFGNEGQGLDDSFRDLAKTVRIETNEKVDSLNLSVSVGIALYNLNSMSFPRKSLPVGRKPAISKT